MHTKTVRGVRDLGVIKGATGPHIVECDDGKRYVVKFAGKTKVVANEFVGQALARTVGLPVPDSSFVELDSELLVGSRDLALRAVVPGIHLGTELVPDPLDLGQFAVAP